MALKTTPSLKSKLRSWFLNEPAKFAGLSFVLLAGVTVLYAFVRMLIYGNTPMSPIPVIVLMSVILLFGIYKLIKWLPQENLDRRSFVAVNNGLTLIYFLSFLASTVFLVTSAGRILYYMMWLQYYSMFLFFITLFIASLIYLYVLGLLVANIYAVYRRALGMGVPKWKALLCFPFSFIFLWMPGYLLPEKTNTKPVIEIRSKGYASFTNWVIAQPINAILVFLFVMVFVALFIDFYTACLSLVFAVIFGVWVWIRGVSGFRAAIGGAFTTFATSLNIALIILTIGFFSMSYNYVKNQHMQVNTVQTIELTDAPVQTTVQ